MAATPRVSEFRNKTNEAGPQVLLAVFPGALQGSSATPLNCRYPLVTDQISIPKGFQKLYNLRSRATRPDRQKRVILYVRRKFRLGFTLSYSGNPFLLRITLHKCRNMDATL